ncbi:hypothetical protein EB796_025090 [Bugula neritina]|uniref:Malate synthase n=1 Tax=Bugula neritina TaxID=10212 RepID=A0A7J7IRT3_BUGNE|nr:hypothetical protein EB796_025090 [Bugula neritina]
MAFRVYTAPPPKGCERLFKTVFSAEAKAFIGELYTAFQSDIEELYRRRIKRRVELDTHNQLPDFLSETKAIRENLEWRVDPIPARLRNPLNSEANGIQVDFDDGHCPTWTNQILGYSNIIEFVSGSMPDFQFFNSSIVPFLSSSSKKITSLESGDFKVLIHSKIKIWPK